MKTINGLQLKEPHRSFVRLSINSQFASLAPQDRTRDNYARICMNIYNQLANTNHKEQ